MKGLFIPGITAEMFRSGCLESIEALMSEGKIFDIEYDMVWIPVSEELPEKPKENCDYYFSPIRSKNVKAEEYIVMIDGAKIPTALFWDGEYWFDETTCSKIPYKVIAWMPLPKPYEEQ